MKHAFVFLMSFMVISSLYSQKCEEKNDPFSGDKLVTYDYKARTVYYELKQGSIFFEMTFTYDGGYKITVAKGSEVSFKFENGEVLKLSSVADSYPKIVGSGSYVYTNYTYRMELSKSDMLKLAESKVSVIRYPDANGNMMDRELKGPYTIYTKHILAGAQCIKEHLQ
jgi:hypothetical protein